MPSSHTRRALFLAAIISTLATTGCATLLPGASSRSMPPGTSDGAVVHVAWMPDEALVKVDSVLRDQGYEVRRQSRRVLRTLPRRLDGDSSIVVVAEVIPHNLPDPSSTIVLTGTYSVPSRGVQDAPVLRLPGAPEGAWSHLRNLVERLSSSSRAAARSAG